MRREQYAQYERYRANLPHRVEARRKYQEEHKEQISEYKKGWAANNSQRVASLKRDYYERNREEVISRSKTWAEENAEKVKVAKANNRRRRRAAENASGGRFTVEEFNALSSAYGYACLSCGATLTASWKQITWSRLRGVVRTRSAIFSLYVASVTAASSQQLSTTGQRLRRRVFSFESISF
jgi:hypothetical protein